MIECGSCLCFTLEACKRLRVARNTLRKEFQGDKAVQARVLGLVNHTHTATTKLLDDAVVRNGLADERLGLRHLTSMLGCSGRQVNEAATRYYCNFAYSALACFRMGMSPGDVYSRLSTRQRRRALYLT